MDADLFLQQFGHLAQGEGGIKKLRDVILQLAVRGRLLNQESSWKALKLQDLVRVINGRAYSKDELLSAGKTPVLRVGNLFTSNSWYYSDLDLEDDKYCDTGDLIFAWSASFGPFIWKGPKVIYHYHIWKLELLNAVTIDTNFLYWVLQERTASIKAAGHGVSMIHMTKAKMEELPIPLPPLAEQKRIVAKVNELMALCDKLEAEQNAQRTIKTQAVQSTLHNLTSAESHTSLAASLNILERIFGNWFDDLTTVKHLRATILQLAVQGKLVPQDPSDEPASELLKRIEAEKNRQVKIGKIKNSVSSKSHNNYEDLPAGWTSIKWKDLGKICGGGTPSKGKSNYWNGDVCWVSPKDMKADYISSSELRITQKAVDETSVHPIPEDSILIVARSGILKRMLPVAINVVPCTVNQDIKALVPYLTEMNRYLMLMLKGHESFILKSLVKGGMTVQSLLYDEFADHAFPLPPLAEQKRIVAKVDELMALCDQLEAHINHTQTLNTHLMDSLIHRMTEAA